MKRILSALCILSMTIAGMPFQAVNVSAASGGFPSVQNAPVVSDTSTRASLSAVSGTKLPANSVTSERSLNEVYQLYQDSLYNFSTADMFEEEPVLEAGAYKPGKLSDQAKQLTLDQLNYMRTLYGVNELRLYEDKIDNSQYGATGLEITGKLTHHFTDDDLTLLADYMTQDQISLASDAIGAGIEHRTSGTYLWNGNCSSSNNIVGTVKGYIDDTNNVASGVGHRLNLLCLIGSEVTFGSSLNRYSCMSIYGNPFDYDNNEAFYAWPAEGYFPRLSMADNALWSVELGKDYSVDEAALAISLIYQGQTYEGTLVLLDDNDNGQHQTITYSLPSELRSLIKASSDVYDEGGQAPVEVIIEGIKNGSDDCYLDYTTTFFIDKPAPVIELESISLDQTSVTLDEGDTLQLTAQAHPDGAKLPQLTWSSSDEDIASVNASGLVTAVKEGTAVITAAAEGGITASCTVEVLHTHAWELTGWTWQDDFNGAEASFICQGCGMELTYPAEISSYLIQEASCTEDGAISHTASVVLEGTTYTDYKEQTIPATGHDYGDPVWTWAEDYSTAAAAFTCKNDASHMENVSATVTSEVTKEATEEEEGLEVYTASVTFNGNSYTDTVEKTIPRLDHVHVYGQPEWLWASDHNRAIATFTCQTCGEEISFIADISSVKTEPTCTEEGLEVFTASVEFEGNYYSDSVEVVLPATGHQYGSVVVSWSPDYKYARATHVCQKCNDVESADLDITTETIEANCTAAGSTIYTATGILAGEEVTDTKALTIPALGHKDDGTGHCSRCGASLISLPATTPTLVNTAKGIKLTFKKVTGATHYQICRRLKSSEKGEPVETSFTLVTTIPSTINSSTKINYYDSATATGKNGNTYVYYIRPLVMDGDTVVSTGATKNVQVRRVATPEIKSCTNSGAGKVTIKWSKNSLATGYDVWYSDGKNKTTIRINGIATVSKVIIGLTKGKTYTFKVRSFYKTSSGTIYKSAWKATEIKITR